MKIVSTLVNRGDKKHETSVIRRPGKILYNRWLTGLVLLLGIGARLAVTLWTHNFDVESYKIVVNIMRQGDNVYAETSRYNYGPIWLNILYVSHMIASFFPAYYNTVFRYLLAMSLSVVDVGIFIILWKKFGKIVASLFFLNPISIIITGYHNQFDNLAVFLGMVGVIILGNEFDKPINKRKGLGLLIFGLSLITKHLLFAFPFWLAVKQRGMWSRLIIIMAPTLLFFAGFLPYWKAGNWGIINNVLLYQSKNNQFLLRILVADATDRFFLGSMVWLFCIVIFAFILKAKNSFDSLLFYTCVLVAASPAITNQYLAIVVPFIAVNLNLFFILYILVGTWYLLIDTSALNIGVLQSVISIDRGAYYAILTILLWLGLIRTMWQQLSSPVKNYFVRYE